MLTCEQYERLLGIILMGASTETAAELLGVTLSDVAEQEDRDPTFRNALFCARTMRDAIERQMLGADQPE